VSQLVNTKIGETAPEEWKTREQMDGEVTNINVCGIVQGREGGGGVKKERG
jgi:hypothetical protein